jgi:hypothetical protein
VIRFALIPFGSASTNICVIKVGIGSEPQLLTFIQNNLHAIGGFNYRIKVSKKTHISKLFRKYFPTNMKDIVRLQFYPLM